ncbi:MAG: SH3 domain-containing protein [Sandaracinus sp.]
MRTRHPATLLLVVVAGCGGATNTSPAPSTPGEATTEPAPEAQGTPVGWLSNDLVRCVRGVAEPAGAPLAGAGTGVRVRAGSIAFEDGEDPIVCEAVSPPPGQLVLVVDSYGGLSVGALEGDRLVGLDDPPRVVRLEGASEITTLRSVHYCPDGTEDCVVAGAREAIDAYSDHDPSGPRSGWDVTTTTLAPARRRRAGTEWLGERVCGLEVGLRGVPDSLECAGSLAERLGCFTQELNAGFDEAETAAFFLVLADGRSEITLPAFEVASLACVEGHVLVQRAHLEFSSVRGYGAVTLREGRIVGGHTMSIRDHEEDRSDCGNAWDGVQLVPVLREGAPIGGLVLGAGGRPLFELARGDVGDISTPAMWPGEGGEPPRALNEAGLAYGDERVPLALRETAEGLFAIAAPDAAPVCTLEVNDADGQTNVRPDPSTRREPVGTLPNGTQLHPAEQRGRWYRLETPLRGWVFATSLRRRCDAR